MFPLRCLDLVELADALDLFRNDVHSPVEADMAAKVDVIEMMGNEIFLYLMTKDEKQFIARVDPRVRSAVGDEVTMAINMANAHIFDPKTEQSLSD